MRISKHGFKTTHSLRVTTATRLFQSGVEEQLIMSRTGHHSIEGIRTYKRISEEQKLALSSVLNNATNGIDIDQPPKKRIKLMDVTSHQNTTLPYPITLNSCNN